MDVAKFKAIFSKEIYRLPIRWDGKDFYATLYNHLKEYRKDIENYPNLWADVNIVCSKICAAIDYSFRGYPGKAYESMKEMMKILIKDPLLIDAEEIKKENLYRVVDFENAAKPRRQRIFHVPFKMRSKISTQRYSIPGFPCLYLGTSVELCCMETGIDLQRDYAYVSRYELQTDNRIYKLLFGFDRNPVFDNDRFMIFDVSIKPDQAIAIHQYYDSKDNAEFINQYIRWYPLISACSYIRAMRDNPYSAEYIIPQLFLQWVRSEDEDAVVGIKYFSCVSDRASYLGNNYVFPTMGASYLARRKADADYCARLSHRFILTFPRFIREYESLGDCVRVVNEDNDLNYIEDYDAGEDIKIEGDYKIPEGVSAVGAFAFSGCNLLTSISIPDSVTSIGASAFSGCSSLVNIIVDNSNESYMSVDGVLYSKDMTKLICYPAGKNQTSFDIPNDVTSIGAYAFYGCSSLTSLVIPDSVTSIGDRAFSGCSSLTSLVISESVTSIGASAFSGCSSLENITVNNTNEFYTSVDDVLYSKDITKLICYPAGKNQTSLVIPESVTSIGDDAFYDCSSLTSLVIPDSVTSIGDRAFSGCNSLQIIILPESVTSIGNSAFFGCNSLQSIILPESVMNIGALAFSACSSLANIIIDNNSNESYVSVDDILYSKDMTKLICCPAGKNQTSISIPDGVTSIDAYAFYGCSLLTSISIPDCVKSIGNWAFVGCSLLISISIPDGVESIGAYAFSSCSSLKIIILPGSVTSIGAYAFYGCSLLANITVNNSNESYTSEDGALYSKDMTKLICYPAGKNQTNIRIPDSVTSIGASAFSSCISLTNIRIPDSVTSIDADTFSGCSLLKSIIIPDSVTSIGAFAFDGCSSLKTVYYSGTKEQVEGIIIGKNNECLKSANWVYGSSGSES